MNIYEMEKYLQFLGFNKVLRIVSIYSLNNYQIIVDNHNTCSIYMYYNNKELYKANISRVQTDTIIYSMVNIFELGDENMNAVTEKITNDKCIKKIKDYVRLEKGIYLINSDRTGFVINDKNVIFVLDNTIPIHVIKRDFTINRILEEYHFVNNKKELEENNMDNVSSFDKFIELRALLDKRIREEQLRRDILFGFNTSLMNIGFKSYKNNTIFKYTDDVRIVEREKTIELYYFGYKESFVIENSVIDNIIDRIIEIESRRIGE